jgi:hypothetical protein
MALESQRHFLGLANAKRLFVHVRSNLIQGARQVVADRSECTDAHNSDQGSDQTIFNGGRAFFIFEELLQHDLSLVQMFPAMYLSLEYRLRLVTVTHCEQKNSAANAALFFVSRPSSLFVDVRRNLVQGRRHVVTDRGERANAHHCDQSGNQTIFNGRRAFFIFEQFRQLHHVRLSLECLVIVPAITRLAEEDLQKG